MQLNPHFPVYSDRTAVIFSQALNTFKGGRFTRSVYAEQSENLSFFYLKIKSCLLYTSGLDGRKVDEKFIMDIVRTLGLEEKLHNLPNTLSGGQQQRVAIVRALASKPDILCADEPTGNLDSHTSEEVIGLLKMSVEKYGQTLVMITHDEDIAQIADRILVIEDGKVEELQ